VDESGDGEEGLWKARENAYDAIILDIMLPGRDGLEVLETLRRESCDVPVLMLTARDAIEDRVQGCGRVPTITCASPLLWTSCWPASRCCAAGATGSATR
jgi:CheY-like chemotaxis protein